MATAATTERSELFEKLSHVFRRHANALNFIRDEPGALYVESKTTLSRGKPLWLGGVTTHKSYVSFHFIPVVNPKLAKTLSPDLKKRKAGKSCFNFSAYDAELTAELDRIVDAGLKSLKPGELDLTGMSC